MIFLVYQNHFLEYHGAAGELVFILDDSDTAGEEILQIELRFVMRVISLFEIDQDSVRVSVVTYGDSARVSIFLLR